MLNLIKALEGNDIFFCCHFNFSRRYSHCWADWQKREETEKLLFRMLEFSNKIQLAVCGKSITFLYTNCIHDTLSIDTSMINGMSKLCKPKCKGIFDNSEM